MEIGIHNEIADSLLYGLLRLSTAPKSPFIKFVYLRNDTILLVRVHGYYPVKPAFLYRNGKLGSHRNTVLLRIKTIKSH